ncbi:MAG: hypothetical protein HY889_07565 [Deltaproteobacteria bacterium]|nr:hypothetical protein [Deltaproteobacteria bacterium]
MILIITMLVSVTVTDSLATELTKSSHGIKATLKTTPGKNMVDIYLYDSKTLKPVKEARVSAKITLPDRTGVERELMGMAMDGAFSYMNSLDFSQKGRYKFDILVDAGSAPVKFSFVLDEK